MTEVTTPLASEYEKFVTDLKNSFAKYHGAEPNTVTRSYSINRDMKRIECVVTVRLTSKPQFVKMTAVYEEKEGLL